VDDQFSVVLRFLFERLSKCRPVHVEAWHEEKPMVLFTDGAFEPEQSDPATIGSILYDPEARTCRFFAGAVPEWLPAQWQKNGSKQVIGQAEILPVLVAYKLFYQDLRSKLLLSFVDNESARASLVSGGSRVEASSSLLNEIMRVEEDLDLKPWFARVPSPSNPSDLPSRLKVGLTKKRFRATQVAMPVFDELWLWGGAGRGAVGE